MIQIAPFYCPNCDGLAFVQRERRLIVDFHRGHWSHHPCRLHNEIPILELDYVKLILASKADDGYPFKYVESGHHRHQEPSQGVVLRLPHQGKLYYQIITTDNGIFEIKFHEDPKLKKGQLIGLPGIKRVGPGRFRVTEWSFLDLPEELGQQIPGEIYRLTLKHPEQQILERHCERLLTHFIRSGTPVLGILPGLIEGEAHCRHILLGHQLNVITALEKVDLPAQVERSFHQITAEQLI